MDNIQRHVIRRLRHYGIGLAWQALMLASAFMGYCVVCALMMRMAPVWWFAAIYVSTGLVIQAVKEIALLRAALSESR